MSNKLFREREATALRPSSLKPQQLDAQQKTGETTSESHLGIQNFNEKIQRWFGKFVKALKLRVKQSFSANVTGRAFRINTAVQ